MMPSVMNASSRKKAEVLFVLRKILIRRTTITNPNTEEIRTAKREAGVNGEPILVKRNIIEFMGWVMIFIGLAKPPYSL
jgi:hypothetical protein